MAYKGVTAPLPVGLQGFSGSKNPSQMVPGHLAYVDGLDYEGDLLRKEGGAMMLNMSMLGAAVISGIHWMPSSTDHFEVVFLNNGTVKRDVEMAGTFAVTLASGLNTVRDPPPFFVPAGGESVGSPRRLFLFSATNQVRYLNDTDVTMSVIGSPAADWASSFPFFGIQHAGRLWAGGNGNDQHRIYYSTTSDHRNFTGAGSGSLAIFPADGSGLVGGISFRGLLILFKWPTGIFIVDTTDPTPANWSVQKLSGAVGGINPHTIIHIENDVLYMDHNGGIHVLSATAAFGDLETSDVGRPARLSKFMKDNINLSAITRAAAVWYPFRQQAWFSLPGTGSTDNNVRVIMDFQNIKLGPRFLISRRDTALSMWLGMGMEGVFKPSTGDPGGVVWLMDQEDRTKDGMAYPMRFETANTDLSFLDPSLATKMKAGQFLEIVSEPVGDWDMTVEVYWDDVLSDTLSFDMGGGAATLDNFTLDTDALGSNVVRNQRRRISGSGRRLKLICYNEGAGQDVAIAEFLLGFGVMDERTRET